jgi:hypothetical protein
LLRVVAGLQRIEGSDRHCADRADIVACFVPDNDIYWQV